MKTPKFALRAAIIYPAIIPLLCFPALVAGQDAPGRPPVVAEMCFPLPVAERLLEQIERIPGLEGEATACEAYQAGAEKAIEACEARADTLSGRVDGLTSERDEARKLYDEQKKAGEAAAKAASPSWWQRAKSAGGWMGLGAVVAAVAILLL